MEMYFLLAGACMVIAVICFDIWYIFREETEDEIQQEKSDSHREINELFSKQIKNSGESIVFNRPWERLNGCAPSSHYYNSLTSLKQNNYLASTSSKFHGSY